ncbi:alpha/beta-hydrolase [Aspergillus californicus]
MATPGILYVTMEPRPRLSDQQFHEWYNNEHGPTRLRLPHIFTNGFRYRANDGQKPTYMAVYDVTAMSLLQTPTYTSLRGSASQHELATMAQVDVNRFFYDLIWEKKGANFVPIEQLTDNEAEGIELIATRFNLAGAEGDSKFAEWYSQEHVGLLSKVPGWLRTRLFKTSTVDETGQTAYLAYNEFSKTNGLGGPEHQASISTPWARDVAERYIISKERRTYSLFYIFGSAPRDTESLAKLASSRDISAEGSSILRDDGLEQGTLFQFIKAPDGLCIPYKLEGNPDPKAPVVVFVNSLLTSMHMWNFLIPILKEKRPHLRFLRYDARGRNKVPRREAATLSTLAADLHSLLAALRISKVNTLIGVSIGGATALKASIDYPDIIEKLVVCDIGCKSPANASQMWQDRIAVAKDNDGEGIQRLATQTVSRWFHPRNMQNEPLVTFMTEMVATNNVEGFTYSCTALWDYDLGDQLPLIQAPTLLVAGEEDGNGAVPKGMEAFKSKVTSQGAELKIIPGAGHLPMCETPQAFWQVIDGFLARDSCTQAVL